VHLAGCTPTPSAPWVTQHARQLTWSSAERPEHVRFLIRDRDQKFTHRFDEVFRADGIEIIRTPFRAPQANGGTAVEPMMDVEHVARAIVYMASLPLDANVLFMTVMATKMPLVGRG